MATPFASCVDPFLRAALSSGWLLDGELLILPRLSWRRAGRAARRSLFDALLSESRHDLLRNVGYDITPQLGIFARVLLLQAESIIFVHVAPAQIANLVLDVKQNLFGTASAVERVFILPHVPSRDVGAALARECDAIAHLLAPSFAVEPWIVPGFLAGVNVHPSFLHLRIHLGPDMILEVPHPAHPTADRATEHAEAVGPLATPTLASLH